MSLKTLAVLIAAVCIIQMVASKPVEEDTMTNVQATVERAIENTRQQLDSLFKQAPSFDSVVESFQTGIENLSNKAQEVFNSNGANAASTTEAAAT